MALIREKFGCVVLASQLLIPSKWWCCFMSWKKPNLRKQFEITLVDKFNNGFGTSRRDDKNLNLTSSKIYSKTTFKTYLRHCRQFADFVRERHPEITEMEDCFQFRNEYIQHLIDSGASASTIKTNVASLSKVYSCHASDFIKTPPRCRAENERSRHAVRYDRHFSLTNPENQKLISFCRSTGLRRNELEHLRGDWLVEIDGKYFLDFTGQHSNACKGGRPRLVPVINDIDLVVEMCRNAGSELVFPVVHHACDVHHYRSEYAKSFYDAEFAREYPDGIDTVPKSDLYICRNDEFGRVLSRKCMKPVSEALGHSRIQIISSNYLYN